MSTRTHAAALRVAMQIRLRSEWTDMPVRLVDESGEEIGVYIAEDDPEWIAAEIMAAWASMRNATLH